jgi:hypothetical protein
MTSTLRGKDIAPLRSHSPARTRYVKKLNFLAWLNLDWPPTPTHIISYQKLDKTTQVRTPHLLTVVYAYLDGLQDATALYTSPYPPTLTPPRPSIPHNPMLGHIVRDHIDHLIQ